MIYREEAIQFACCGESLLGILALPEGNPETGVIVVVGGPQYRIGSHRQFLLLSRTLAAAGFACLRFDQRGMGDSSGAVRDFEQIGDDIGAAVSALLARAPSVRRVVLWGLCDAASAILLYCQATQDSRITGLVLLNPWVRSEISLARAQVKHYYGQRLFSAEFWFKLVTGKFEWGQSANGLWARIKLLMAAAASLSEVDTPGSFRNLMPQALRNFPGQVLLILSEQDTTAQEFLDCAERDAAWSGILHRSSIQRCDIPGANHTFSSAAWRVRVEQATLAWLKGS